MCKIKIAKLYIKKKLQISFYRKFYLLIIVIYMTVITILYNF